MSHYGTPSSAPQTGRLFLRSHGDCFIHATNWWLKYWNFSLTKDRLAIVRVTLPKGEFLTTLCPAPLPYENVQKGVRRKQYLEIDPKFAQALGIRPDTEVVMESIRAVEECKSLVLAPVEASDYDKLENFSEKIDYELTDRIRVVSCHISFPIWIDNLVIQVKVLSSDPTAKWVLLVPDHTLVELHRSESSSQSSSTGISIMSSRSTPVQCSSTSAESPDGPSTETSSSTLPPPSSQQTAKRVWDFSSEYAQKKSGRHTSQKSSTSSHNSVRSGSSVDTSPDHSDPFDYSFSSILSNAARLLFSRESSHVDQPTRIDNEQARGRLNVFTESIDSEGFEPTQHQALPEVSVEDVTPPSSTEMNQSSAGSWLGSSSSSPRYKQVLNEIKHTVPLYTGPMYAGTAPPRRVTTPDPTPPAPSKSTGSEPTDQVSKPSHRRWKTWHSETEFNRHPPIASRGRQSPTPRMSVRLRVQPHNCWGISSFRNRSETDGYWSHEHLFDVFVHPSTIPEIFLHWQHLNDESILVEIRPTERKILETKESKNGKSLDPSSKILEDLNDLKDSQSVSSVKSSNESSTPSPWPNSLVVRLRFATKIKLVRGEMEVHIEDGPFGDETKDTKMKGNQEGNSGLADIQVQVGHVVMSDVVRQQLMIKTCSQVRVLHVKDSWRVPPADKPSLLLQPLKPEEKHLIVHIKNGFEEWVTAVSNKASVGGVIVDKQVIPVIKNDKGEWIYCRVKINKSSRRENPNTRISYLLVTPHLIEQNKLHLHIDSVATSGKHSQFTRPGYSRGKRDPSPAREEAIKLPAMKNLNQPVISLELQQFGGLDSLYKEGVEYLRTVFSQPGKGGALLVCGMSGSGGSGCGKSSLAKLLCKHLSAHPYYSNVAFVDCTAMRGLTTHNFKKKMKVHFTEAVLHQPSVILLDDLDHTMPLISDAQEQVGEEGIASMRKTQVLLDLIENVDHSEAQVVIIATAQNKQQLNKDLLQSRGVHVFEKILEINPPSLADRKVIIDAILKSKEIFTMNDPELRSVALKTEGFQSGDLVTLVDRAISLCELRTLYPQGVKRHIQTPSSPDKTFKPLLSPRNRVHTDSSTSDLDINGSSSFSKPLTISSSSPLSTPPSSPRKKYHHPQLELTKSSESNPSGLSKVHKTSVISSDSTHTLIQEENLKSPSGRELHKSTSLSQMRLGVEDFVAALKGFVPVSLRGLQLHKSGLIDFSGVGGLETIKKSLKETLLWPSKYPRLFSQCPIKQRCGVLLYGAPGTGKTMLAGAVAKEFGLNFVSIKGPELLSKYIGASEQAVRDVFTRALCAKPCILFFDEFDSLAPRRGHDNTGVTDRVVNQLLTQLDGVESLQGVYVLAASSRPDLIDPALLRPGRIDKSLLCNMPTEKERREILVSLSRGMPLAPGVNLMEIGSKSPGLTGADLKAVLYSAQLQAAHEALSMKQRGSRQQSLSEVDTDLLETPETSGRGSSIASGSSGRPLVFECTKSGVRKNSLLSNSLESKAVIIQRKDMHKRPLQSRRRFTLTWDQDDGGITREFFKKANKKVVITQEHLLAALNQVQPSVPEQELKKFNQIYNKFTGKTKTSVENIKPVATLA